MITFVQTNQAVKVNANDFAWPNEPNGVPLQIPCQNMEIIASYWRIPQYQGNRVTGYAYVVCSETSTKPQPDALKVLRVKLTDTAGITTVDMAILDTDNNSYSSPPNQLAYLCDGLGGTLPVMPTVTIPVPMQQSGPQTDTNGLNTFVFTFPSNPLGLGYTLNGAWFNGAAPYVAIDLSGITTVAGFVSWANSNLSNYGTFTALSAVTFKLVSNTASATIPVFAAGISVDLTPVYFCFSLSGYSTPAVVNQFEFGTGGIQNFKVPFMLTNNPVVLQNQLIPVMSTGTVFDSTSYSHQLGILTTQALPKLYNNGVLVVASTAGIC